MTGSLNNQIAGGTPAIWKKEPKNTALSVLAGCMLLKNIWITKIHFLANIFYPCTFFLAAYAAGFFYPFHKLGVGRKDFLRHPQQNRENDHTTQIYADPHLCNYTKFSNIRLPDLKKTASRPLTYERGRNAGDILSLKCYRACLFYLSRSNTKMLRELI